LLFSFLYLPGTFSPASSIPHQRTFLSVACISSKRPRSGSKFLSSR
jgi:hypothetical protein